MASFEELASQLTLDASDYTGELDDAAAATEDFSAETDEAADSLIDLDSAGVAAGAGFAAAGTAAQSALDSTQPLRESLGRTATTMGTTSEEANELARSMSNATFPVEDVTGAMDSLATQGVDSEEQMREVATAADRLADATGTTATSVAEEAGPALRAMGSDIDELSEHMDTFTAIARNTTQDVESFSNMVTRAGPELQEMGMGVEDTAAVMLALEERGLSGRQAIREFRQAAREAEGDQAAFRDELGLSEDELAEYNETLTDAEGITVEHAEAANESLSTWDEIRAAWDDAKLAAGEMLGPVDAIAPAMQAAGGAAIAWSTINFSALVPSLGAVAAAVSAAALPLTAISAVVVGLAAAWETNFLGIQQITEDVIDVLAYNFDFLRDAVQGAVEWVIDAVAKIPEAIGGVIDAIPGIDSEDVLGDFDADEITDSLFPPEPGEEAKETGEEMGEGLAEGVESGMPDAVGPEDITVDAGDTGMASDIGGAVDIEEGDAPEVFGDAESRATTTGTTAETTTTSTTSTTSSRSGGGGGGLSQEDVRVAFAEGMRDVLDEVNYDPEQIIAAMAAIADGVVEQKSRQWNGEMARLGARSP